MKNIIVAGIGTDVGKTVVSAILATVLKADYWKPIQCGSEKDSDSFVMKSLLYPKNHHIFPPAYAFNEPCAPQKAASIESKTMDCSHVNLPITSRYLVIEGVGGVLVPLNEQELCLDLFKKWTASWIVVSKHYLGSINHTLLTTEILKQHQLPVLGLIFNGNPDSHTESAILNHSQLPMLARLLPENTINYSTIQRYSRQWTHRYIYDR